MSWHSGRMELSLIKEVLRKAEKLGETEGDVSLSGRSRHRNRRKNKQSHQEFFRSKSMWEDNNQTPVVRRRRRRLELLCFIKSCVTAFNLLLLDEYFATHRSRAIDYLFSSQCWILTGREKLYRLRIIFITLFKFVILFIKQQLIYRRSFFNICSQLLFFFFIGFADIFICFMLMNISLQ